jgi:P-type Ca2+ transporter type 2C
MATTADAPVRQSPPDEHWYTLPPDEVTGGLDVDASLGLSEAEAAARLERYGANKFAVAAKEPRWRAFLRQYRDGMQIVLLVAGIGSIWPLHELGTGLVIIFLTLFNAVLGLRQEGSSCPATSS